MPVMKGFRNSKRYILADIFFFLMVTLNDVKIVFFSVVFSLALFQGARDLSQPVF